MDKLVRTRLKEAKKLYQQGDYEQCYCEIQDVLTHEPDLYNAIVLKGACCERLGLDEAGIDCYFNAINLDAENVLAWQGLLQLGSKNTDRYYSTLVHVCLRLLKFYADPQLSEKRFSCARFLIELMVRYRLELPEDMTDVRSLCLFVLKSSPSNCYALEMLLRLKFERFLTYTLPCLISPTLLDNETEKSRWTKAVEELTHPDTLSQLASLKSGVELTSDTESQTAKATVQIGKLFLEVATSMVESGDDWRSAWATVFNQVDRIEINGLVGLSEWCRRGYMDIHVSCLHALAAFKLCLFDHCETVLKKMLAYCKSRKPEAAAEAHYLSVFPTVPLSQLTDFLTPRPMINPFLSTPAQLFTHFCGINRSSYDLLEEFILVIRLANASASEQKELAAHLAASSVPLWSHLHEYIFFWPPLVKTLWVECCLTGGRLDLALTVLCPTDAKNVSFDAVMSATPLFDLSDKRFQLCCIRVAVEFILTSNIHSDTITKSLDDLAHAAYALIHPLNSLRSARDHFLLAQLFARLDKALVPDRESINLQLQQYKAGIEADNNYHLNYLYLGQLYRCRLNDLGEAVSTLTRAHELVPNCAATAYELALTFCQNNQLNKAFHIYSNVDKTKFTKEMWLNYGLVTLRLGLSLQSVPALQKVVICDPQNALYWEILGEAYLLRRSYETAVKTLNRSIHLDPIRPLPYVLCGRTYRLMGDFYQANKTLASGVELSRSHFLAGRLNRDVLILALKEIVELKLFEAQTHIRQGLSGRAINEFQSVLLYADDVFEQFSAAESAPVWAYHYVASAFSLLSVINDPDMGLTIPTRFVNVLGVYSDRQSVMLNAKNCYSVSLSSGLQIALTYYAYALKAWRRTPVEPAGISESPSIVNGCLLVTLGLHCLSHAFFLSRYPHLIRSRLTPSDPVILSGLAESVFKHSVTMLTERAAEDQRFLDEQESVEEVSEIDKIAQMERSEEQVVGNRLAFNRTLRSYAWHGLALLYSSVKDSKNIDLFIDYCLCQSLMARPTATESATSLALRYLRQGRIQAATSLLAQYQASDSENYLVWLASAHLHALTNAASKPSSSRVIPSVEVNHAVLQDLLQAACLGVNVQLASQLSHYLFPTLIKFACTRSNRSALNPLMESGTFVRLAMEVTLEALNRALAFEPGNAYLWHDRALLLQLAGLSAPANYCVRRALELWTADDVKSDSAISLQRCHSHAFLLSYIRNASDWAVADQLLAFSGNANVTVCSSLAEAFAKGYTFLRHPQLQPDFGISNKCLVEEPLRLASQGHSVALATLEAVPDFGKWLLFLELVDSVITGKVSILDHSEMFNNLPVAGCHPRLARMLTFIGTKLCRMLPPVHPILMRIQSLGSVLEEMVVTQLSEVSGHALTELDCLGSTELALWAMDHASVCAYVSCSDSTGFVYLSRLIALRPDDPNLWTALAWWKLVQATLPDPYKTTLKKESHIEPLALLIRVLEIVLQSHSETPLSPLLANTLCQCTRQWLVTHAVANLESEHHRLLLAGLRRAAVFHPCTPDVILCLGQLSSPKCLNLTYE